MTHISRLALCAALLTTALTTTAAMGEPWPERGFDVSQRVGLGAFSGDAPASVRYFWQDRYGFDAGLGFSLRDTDGRNRTQVVLDAGFLYALAPGERVNLFARPGLQFRDQSGDPGTQATVRLSLGLEAEFFLTRSLSIGARTGVYLDTISPPGGAGNRVEGGTVGEVVTGAGFHFYLGRPD